MTKKHEFLSLGGGIQSTALLLMSLHGEIPNPCTTAVFSDTGWERETTYATVDWLREYALEFGVEVITVSSGNIREDTLTPGAFNPMPVFVDNGKGKGTMLRRQCTRQYKISPIQKEIRRLTGCTFKSPVSLWMGISIDEVSRMKPSRVKYLQHRFPLIEKRLTRRDCVDWMRANGFDVPAKSACVGCPFHGNSDWQDLTEAEIADAADFENRMQAVGMYKRKNDNDATPYLHKSLVPIGQKPFQKNTGQLELDLQSEECEGGCFL